MMATIKATAPATTSEYTTASLTPGGYRWNFSQTGRHVELTFIKSSRHVILSLDASLSVMGISSIMDVLLVLVVLMISILMTSKITGSLYNTAVHVYLQPPIANHAFPMIK